MTLAVRESHRLPESMEAALYLCGRLLLDAVSTTAGPVAVTLTVSADDVQLAATAPTGVDDDRDMRREHARRLLADRLAVLGGGLTTTSSDNLNEISCQVPLSRPLREIPGGHVGAVRLTGLLSRLRPVGP